MSSASLSSTASQNITGRNVSSDGGHFLISGLRANLAETMEQCLSALERNGIPIYPQVDDGSLYCNATWDTVLCWPAIPAGSNITLQCPPLKGLDPSKNITKFCHSSGRWMGKTEGDFSRLHGWTNFTMCFTQEVVDIMRMNNGSLVLAQEIARSVRAFEFVGLGLSFISLILCIFIFSCFRQLRVFRNLLHLQLFIAILCMVIIRLILYIDLVFTNKQHVVAGPDGRTINTMAYVCELAYFLLEYFKTVAFWWMFLEGFYLHNQLVIAVFDRQPRLFPYLLAGYGIPFIHTGLWLLLIVIKKHGKVEKCLGNYYLESDFWLLDGPRMFQLVINTFFVCNVIRVLWSKLVTRESQNSNDTSGYKKSVKATLMLIFLLGLPNIMQTIPFTPTQNNIIYFAIWTYFATFFYMYQGLIVSIIYCFTNKEVISVIKFCYDRYKLRHTNHNDLRRGSRSIVSYYQVQNGNVTTSLDGNFRKKESNASSTIKMIDTRKYSPRRSLSTDADMKFTFSAADENTPLKSCLRCDENFEFGDDPLAAKKSSVVTFMNHASPQ